MSRSTIRTPHSALGRPYVVVNMAMTADGKIATANREISSFGSKWDHDNLLALRATADAVLCGAGTAGGDNITMGPGGLRYRRLRKRRKLAEYNLRVIASGSAKLSRASSIFSHRFSPILVLTTESAPVSRRNRLEKVAEKVATFGSRALDLRSALGWLRKEWKVRRLICEGGGELNDAMFQAGLVDEVRVTVCPKVFGGRTAPTIAEGSGFPALNRAAKLSLRSQRLVKDEMFLAYDVVAASSRVSTHRAISQRTSDKRLK